MSNKKNLSFLHAAAPSALLAGSVPYLTMKKKKGETEEQFKARRRGIAAAAATVAGIGGGHFIPPALLGRRMKTASLENYFAKARVESRKKLEESRRENRDALLMFQSEKDLEESAAERRRRREQGFTETGLLGRSAQGLAGAALVGKNVPLLGGAKGSQMLYHGTGLRGLQGILGEDADKGGLRLEYAGTKGRLNAHLMPNAIVKQVLEDEKIDLSDAELARVQTRLALKIQHNKGTPIMDLIGEEIDEIAGSNNLSEEQVTRMKAKSGDSLREAGMRIYFANSPEKVINWSDDLHEGQKIMNAFMGEGGLLAGAGEGGFDPAGDLKRQAKVQLAMMRAGADLATGGIRDSVSTIKQQHDYLRDLNVHPEKVSREFVRDLAAQKNYAHVLGVDVPTADVQELADFKGIKTPLRLSTGLQGLLGSVPGFEGYDPNKDISTGFDVAQSNIKSVDLVDPETNQATRYFLDSYEAPSLTAKQRLKSLGRASVPLALTGMGADALYRAVSGRKGVLGTAMNAYRDRKKSKSQEKTSSFKFANKAHTPIRTAIKNVGMYGVPTVAAGLGFNALNDAIGRKIIPVTEAEYAPQDFKDEIEGVSREGTRMAAGQGLKVGLGMGLQLGTSALGGVLGRRLVRKRLPELMAAAEKGDTMAAPLAKALQSKGTMIGAGVGMAAPAVVQLAGLYPSMAYERAARGRDDLRQELGATPEEIMETPWKSAVIPTLATLGVSAGLGGSAMKHFPGLIRRVEHGLASSMPMVMPKKVESYLDSTLNRMNKNLPLAKEDFDLAEKALRQADQETFARETSLDALREKAQQIKDYRDGLRLETFKNMKKGIDTSDYDAVTNLVNQVMDGDIDIPEESFKELLDLQSAIAPINRYGQ